MVRLYTLKVACGLPTCGLSNEVIFPRPCGLIEEQKGKTAEVVDRKCINSGGT